MSTETTVSDSQQTVSDGDDNQAADTSDKTTDSSDTSKTVSYESHQRLLRQRKADQVKLTRLDELEAQDKERVDDKLKASGNYEKMLSARDTEISDLKTKLTDRERTLTDGVKLQAFLDKLPGKVKRREFLKFVKIDDIALDPETNSIDTSSLEVVVNGFVKDYSDLIQPNNTATLPHDQANAGGGSLAYDDWLKLPLKEKRARSSEVIKSRTKH